MTFFKALGKITDKFGEPYILEECGKYIKSIKSLKSLKSLNLRIKLQKM